MQSLKDKMYNYEVTPPAETWQVIATALDKDIATSSRSKKRSKVFYLSLGVAATIVIFVFGLTFWNGNSGKKANQTSVATSAGIGDNPTKYDDKITVPKTSDEIPIKSDANENAALKDVPFETNTKKYITITGPQGQCVNISSKAATLIVSSDNQNPPKPVWSAKVNKWKDIMEANILAPTTANFLDIVELTHALRVDN